MFGGVAEGIADVMLKGVNLCFNVCGGGEIVVNGEGITDFAKVIPVSVNVAVPAFSYSVTVYCHERGVYCLGGGLRRGLLRFLWYARTECLRGRCQDWRDYIQMPVRECGRVQDRPASECLFRMTLFAFLLVLPQMLCVGVATDKVCYGG